MNDEELTALLERLGSQVTVGPAPVQEVVLGGRRRRRGHRGMQLAGIAAAGALVVVGGPVLGPVLSHTGPLLAPLYTTSSSTPALPGRPPAARELVGEWHWVEVPATATLSQLDQFRLTFGSNGMTPPPGQSRGLFWSAYAGCDTTVVGLASIGHAGEFSTQRNIVSDLDCTASSGGAAVTVGGLVAQARWSRLVDGHLQLFDAGGRLLAAFTGAVTGGPGTQH